MDERSAGAVVFHEAGATRRYLLLLNASRWDFPKGNMEAGETELQTVLREVGEETGLKELAIVQGFRKVIRYFYRRDGKNIHKEVIYFLAKTPDDRVKISFEHQGFGWFGYQEAMKRASYDNSRATLAEAERYLARTAPAGEAGQA